jgi:hypothetical protein
VKSNQARGLADTGIIAFCGVASLLGAYYLINGSFVWIYVLGGGFSVIALMLVRAEMSKRLMIAVVSLLLSLAVAEGFLRGVASKDDAPAAGRRPYTKGYSQPLRKEGGPLGYGPVPGRSVRAWKTVGRDRAYDVSYTIDEHGTRLTRGSIQGPGTFLFFGGSFVFGEGIDDEETLPFFFSRQLGFRYNVLNLGFSGYGPHQMLRALEIGQFVDAVAEPVVAAIYVGGPSHVFRLAGRSWWDPFGPSYVLKPDGDVVYEGPFVEIPERWTGAYYTLLKMVEAARRSVVIDQTLDLFSKAGPDTAFEDIDLYVGVLSRASELLDQRYGARLYVLFWDDDGALSGRILKKLADSSLPYRSVSSYLSKTQRTEYRIPRDGHPTAAANEIIANGLASWITSPSGG